MAAKIRCAPQALNDWVKTSEVDNCPWLGVSSEMPDRPKTLEQENWEPREAPELLRRV